MSFLFLASLSVPSLHVPLRLLAPRLSRDFIRIEARRPSRPADGAGGGWGGGEGSAQTKAARTWGQGGGHTMGMAPKLRDRPRRANPAAEGSLGSAYII